MFCYIALWSFIAHIYIVRNHVIRYKYTLPQNWVVLVISFYSSVTVVCIINIKPVIVYLEFIRCL
jgi:hypothetical protein